jgi:hypothetical protein
MRVMPSKEMLERTKAISAEIETLEQKIQLRGYGFRRIKLDDLDIYSGIVKKSGKIRIMVGDRPLIGLSCAQRVSIWSEVKDLIN